nr:ATP-binding protein [Actinosynnema mirum]
MARALAEERGALARELHDTISHHVSAIGVHAGADRLPDSLDVAAYRVAQELLTNALRHGDGERVELRITQSAAELVVSVVNGVRPGPPAHGTRRGLDGVRRRAALFGGGVVCGPGGGSWRATATFPPEATPRRRSWPPGRPPGCCC